MKTSAYIKIVVASVLLVVAVQACSDTTPPPPPPPSSKQSWESGETTITLSHDDGTLRVCGKGVMEDYYFTDRRYDMDVAEVNKVANKLIIEEGVTHIGERAFADLHRLKSITIPGSVKSIGAFAFSGCTGLTFIRVAADNVHYSSENGILFNKDKTILIQYPPGRLGTSYTIPGSVTSIGIEAFHKCTGLTSIVIPNSVETIESQAFFKCTGLMSITIPGSVKYIGYGAFYDCVGLTSVTIPSSVTFIGDKAFAYCTSLTSIVNLNPTPPKACIEPPKGMMPMPCFNFFAYIEAGKACLYVPARSVNSYRRAMSWDRFNCVKPLESAPKVE